MFYKHEIIFIACNNVIIVVIFSDFYHQWLYFFIAFRIYFQNTWDLKYKIHKNVHVTIHFLENNVFIIPLFPFYFFFFLSEYLSKYDNIF